MNIHWGLRIFAAGMFVSSYFIYRFQQLPKPPPRPQWYLRNNDFSPRFILGIVVAALVMLALAVIGALYSPSLYSWTLVLIGVANALAGYYRWKKRRDIVAATPLDVSSKAS